LALVEGFELSEHAGRAATAAATNEGSDGLHGGILKAYVCELATFLRHSREGKILIALDEPAEFAGVLLREEALGGLDEEIDVQANCAESDQQNQKLVAKNPTKGNIVGAQQAIEGVFGKPVQTIVFAGFVAQEARAHHRRGRKRDQKRNANGHAENHRELTEEPAYDAAHEKNGNKDSHEGGAHGKHGESNFARTFHRGFVGLHTTFDVTCDVLDDHDGIVNDEAGTDGEGHQRKIV